MCTNDIKSNPIGFQSPQDGKMLYEEVKITTKDKLKLYGWFIHQQNPKNHPTFIYFHENAGSKIFYKIKQTLDSGFLSQRDFIKD